VPGSGSGGSLLDPLDDKPIVLGKVIGFYGVRGWVKVHSDTDPRENIVRYRRWWLGDASNKRAIEVVQGKRVGKNVVAKIAGIETREQAATLLGSTISILRSDLPALPESEVYWTDLVGCDVFEANGERIGPVKRLIETGANDVLIVKDERLDKADEIDQTSGVTASRASKPTKSENKSKTSKRQDILIPWLRPQVILEVDLSQKRISVDWDPDF